jgi:probable F420-dependent oxidoreductase
MAGIGGFGGRRLAALMGRVGVWSFALQRLAAAEETAAARELERLGFPAIWIPESLGSKELLSHASILLQSTERVAIASGIANIYARDPMAMANGAKALGEAHPGRFVLGIGVSHAPSVESRGGAYGKPVETMSAYLDAMAAAQYAAPEPDPPVPLVLAALGPRMLELAAARADGAHPYFVPVEHTPVPRRRDDRRPDREPRGWSPDRAVVREELPRPSELRQQPPTPRLVGRGPRGGGERATHRRGHRDR